MKRHDDFAEALRRGRDAVRAGGDCPSEALWVELLQGDLEDTAAEALRAHLVDCPKCATTARDARRFLAAIGPAGRRTRRLSDRRVLVVAAAGVLVAFGLGFFLVRAERAADAAVERLIAELEVALPQGGAPGSLGSELVFRGGGGEPGNERSKALQAYRERRWETACTALDREGRSPPDERELRFFAAVACLKAGELDRADGLLASLAAVEGGRRDAAREMLDELRRARGGSAR